MQEIFAFLDYNLYLCGKRRDMDYIYYCEKLLHRIEVAKRLGKEEMEVSIASVEYPKCSQMGRVPMSVIEGIERVLEDYLREEF